MKVYISGKISGLSKEEYMKNFAEAEELLSQHHSVINPAKTNGTLPSDTTYEEYMDISMKLLSFCDAIFMLRNWKDSIGANAEHAYAKAHGYMIVYQEDKTG